MNFSRTYSFVCVGLLSLVPYASVLRAQEMAVASRQKRDKTVTPGWAVKTNLLYDATTSMNLGLEFKISGRYTVDISANYNPWTFSENKKLKHVLVQPELRYWPKEAFRGHFLGLHALYSRYNIGGVKMPFGFFPALEVNRYQGNLYGAGIAYGYHWALSPRWRVELELGVGFARLESKVYECPGCGAFKRAETKNLLTPTKAAISLVYAIGGVKAKAPALPAPALADGIPAPVAPGPTAPVRASEPAPPALPEAKEEAVPEERLACHDTYLHFPAGSARLMPDYGRNRVELERVAHFLDSLGSHPGLRLTGVTIRGGASIEGDERSNLILAGQRAYALLHYLKSEKKLLPDSAYSVSPGGEDWDAMLGEISHQPALADYRDELVRIAALPESADRKERLIRRLDGGKAYRSLAERVFPKLRRVSCLVTYTVRSHPGGDAVSE
jgi:outer membrane protein OmpA-like peptidoglycan-associated protein